MILLRLERKIAGNNVLLVTILVLAAFMIAAFTGGGLVDWKVLGSEVLMPFFTCIIVCECVKTLSDPAIDMVAAHAGSLFTWVAARFFAAYGMTSALCALCMAVMAFAAPGASIGELAIIYYGTSFFLSSLGVLASFSCGLPHVSAAVCASAWLLALMLRESFEKRLPLFPALGYFYPFLRFTFPGSPLWIANKAVLFSLGIMMWIPVYFICRKRFLNLP